MIINVHFLVCIAFCYRPSLVACSGNYRPNWWAVQYGRFLPCDAMLSAVYAVVVCLSICLCVSVTFRYCIKMDKRRITHIMRHDRSGTRFQVRCLVVAGFDMCIAESLCNSRASCLYRGTLLFRAGSTTHFN